MARTGKPDERAQAVGPGRGLRSAALDAEDLALWRRVTATLQPLRRERDGAPAKDAPGPGERSAAAPLRRGGRPGRMSPARDRVPAGPPVNTALSRRELRRLTRGRRPLEAVVDLHGLDRIAAHDVLLARLRSLQARGVRTVLVVTGKGRDESGRPPGVLARLLPLWLNEPAFRALVHTARQAAPRHGGEGAAYLLLKRRLTQELFMKR